MSYKCGFCGNNYLVFINKYDDTLKNKFYWNVYDQILCTNCGASWQIDKFNYEVEIISYSYLKVGDYFE